MYKLLFLAVGVLFVAAKLSEEARVIAIKIEEENEQEAISILRKIEEEKKHIFRELSANKSKLPKRTQDLIEAVLEKMI